MRESKLEKYLRESVEAIGGECVKFTSPGRSGVNDRLVFLPAGRMLMIETKATGKTLRPNQARFRKRMRELGFDVYVVSSVDDVDNLIL